MPWDDIIIDPPKLDLSGIKVDDIAKFFEGKLSDEDMAAAAGRLYEVMRQAQAKKAFLEVARVVLSIATNVALGRPS